jgi:hypothetical protein
MQRLRHAGSGTWFAELSEFKAWLGGSSSSVLCYYGIRNYNSFLSADLMLIESKLDVANQFSRRV